MTDINIIGAGRLGKTLMRLFVLKGHRVPGICNLSSESARRAVEFIGQGHACKSISQLPAADLVFITTPDNMIEVCAKELQQATNLRSNAVVVHCSGSLSCEALASLRVQGCAIASIHPMRSFADAAASVSQFAGTYCAVEGDERATVLLGRLFGEIGAVLFSVDPKKKSLYHAAGVLASNYVVTLFDKAVLCLTESGVEHKVATQIALSLMDGTLDNLRSTLSPHKSLTGPIKRGDANTVSQHIEAMPNEMLASVYRAMGLATLDMAQLSTDKEIELRKILS
jgi:predicted short-subunit dehydrogenase-like oxidoreductase (DUF2520 family)